MQTMQAVCTDGHFNTKKAQETKSRETRLHNATPRGDLLIRPDWADPKNCIYGQATDEIQGRGHNVTRPSTLLLHPASFQMHQTLTQMYSIITICITIENCLYVSTIEILTTCCRCNAQTGVTHISLLCINSMRSVKRTSRFLSQKPSAS